ncbi:MAG: hypothetical protein QW320_11175 [Ignisphaera sp.]
MNEAEEREFTRFEEAAEFFRQAVLAGAKRARLERVPSRWERILWTLRRILWTPLTLLCTIRLRYYMWKYRGCEEVPLTLPC